MENGLVRDAIMNFSTETRVNEIALSNPSARRVLEDAGVDYCCGGGKSLQDACLHAGVTTDEILKRLRQNRELVGPGDTEWATAPLADLTRHIRERHHQYVRDTIPRVRALLAKIREKHGPKHREIGEIERLFGDVAREMTAHMQKEEQILFPYIDALERSANGGGTVERDDLGALCSHPQEASLVAAAHPTSLAWCGESRLRNPLR